jgi:hypothetical protein
MSWYLRKELRAQPAVSGRMMDDGAVAPRGATVDMVTAPAVSRTQGSYRTCCGPHIRRYISDMEERKRT